MKFKNKNLYFFFTCLFVLAGCATKEIPRSVGAASSGLKLINESKFVNYQLYTYNSGEECLFSGRHPLVSEPGNRGSLKAGQSYDTRIPSGETFSVSSFVDDASVSCNVIISFVPAKDQNYVMHFDARSRVCWVQVERVTYDNSGQQTSAVAEPSVRQRKAQAAFWHGGAACAN